MSKKNKILIGTLSILFICILIVGISYAYWRLTYTQTGVNKVISSCFSMELANEKNNITLDSAYPISDEKGKALTPYSFTITNTCDLFASYTINLEMLSGTTLNSKYVKTMVNSEAIANLNSLETTDTSIEGATESRVLFKGSLGSGDSTDYTLRIWMDSETPPTDDTMNKIFQGKITVTAEVSTYSPVENGFTLLNQALLVNEYQTTSLDVAKNKINSKQEVDFTKTAPIIIWQENIRNTTQDLVVVKVDPSFVGKYNIAEKAAKVVLGKSYTFNSDTGFYNLEERDYYDPTVVDYTSENYYICNSTITITSNNTVTYWDAISCSSIYKISGLSSVDDLTTKLSGGDEISTKKYTFKAYKMYGTELESDKSDKGLYVAKDDFGDSYYYRGNVSNNYVKFASLYWRIIRINGDGSIRLLYAGDSSNSTGSAVSISNSLYNNIRSNPTYVGYMYSNTLNTSYEDTISNDNDSAAKTTLDTWYKTNIFDTGYSSYIADSGFCNDRSISSDSPGEGVSESISVYYSPRFRVLNHAPTITCQNKANDLFTLTGNNNGNGKLTYPVGLITVDELAFAGYSYGYLNKMNYIYSPIITKTMSPNYYNGGNGMAVIWSLYDDGSLNDNAVSSISHLRPVINLKSTTEIIGGIGTKNDPFIVK